MDERTNQPMKVARVQRIAVYATVVLAAFLIGFVPMWLRARALANERDGVQEAARLTRAENTLGSAAILARRGDYERREKPRARSTRRCEPSSIAPNRRSP